MASTFLADVPPAVAGLGCALGIWSMVRDLRRYAWLTSPAAIVELRRSADGDWQLRTRGARVVPASLRPRAYVHPWIVALVFRAADGRTVRLPISLDMVEREAFRRLRVSIRTGQ